MTSSCSQGTNKNDDTYYLFLCIPMVACMAVLLNDFSGMSGSSQGYLRGAGWSLIFSILGGAFSMRLLRGSVGLFLKARLFGSDYHRPKAVRESEVIPSASGVVTGCMYSCILTMFTPLSIAFCGGIGEHGINGSLLLLFMAALLSINSMCFLGFVDNVLDLRWRIKLLLPTIATLPILLVYYAQGGNTHVLLPGLLGYEPFVVELGFLYYVFLAMIGIFATNAINIYAGINGLESGQTLIIVGSLVVNTVLQLRIYTPESRPALWSLQCFDLYVLVPLYCVTAGLYVYNKYPARVFVGDTFCYLSGMSIAVAGILGHCSKTVLLFMFPQILNFLYSVPQLFHVIPCPRHRMPGYDEAKDQCIVSYTDEIDLTVAGRLTKGCVYLLAKLRLARVTFTSVNTGRDLGSKNQSRVMNGAVVVERSRCRVQNLTLLNAALALFGPMHEKTLTNVLLGFQILWSALALAIRYKGAALIYGSVE